MIISGLSKLSKPTLEALLTCARSYGTLLSHKLDLLPLMYDPTWGYEDGALFPPPPGVTFPPLERRAGVVLSLTYADEKGSFEALQKLGGALVAPTTGVFPDKPPPCVSYQQPVKGTPSPAGTYAAQHLRPYEHFAFFFSAAILPWRVVAGKVQVLLGLENRKGKVEYSMLCGKREDTSDMDAVECAVREADEEAACMFGAGWRKKMAETDRKSVV